MNKSLPIAVGFCFVIILGGCAHGPQYREFGVSAASVASASVQVVDGETIVVSQEPIFVKQVDLASERDNQIFWSLPPGGTYSFPTGPRPGIQFERPLPGLRCGLHNNDKYTFVCNYKRAARGKALYTIRVTDGTRVIESDPTVMNN